MGKHGISPHYHGVRPRVKENRGISSPVRHEIPCATLAFFEMNVSVLFSATASLRASNAPATRVELSRRSVSRVLSTSLRMLDGHSSGTCFAACLDATNPGDGSKTPLRSYVHTNVNAQRRPPLFGLAPGGVYPADPVTRVAVRSYRTVSPLPRKKPRRFVFCGTVPGVAPAGR